MQHTFVTSGYCQGRRAEVKVYLLVGAVTVLVGGMVVYFLMSS